MMKFLQKLSCILVAVCFMTGNVSASSLGNYAEIVEGSSKWRVLFDLNSHEIDLEIGGNRQMLNSIIADLQEIHDDETKELDGVRILGYASPEGNIDYNERLSLLRAEAIKNYILENTTIPAKHFQTKAMGENWEELVTLLNQSTWSKASFVVEIISQTEEGVDPELEIKRILGLSGYNEMVDRFYGKLRTASTFEAFSLVPIPEPEPEVVEPEPEPQVVEIQTKPEPVYEVIEKEKDLRFGVHTNVLYWAMKVTPNIELEYYIGTQYSVAVAGVHRWRNEISAISDEFNLWSLTAEGRRWFTDDNKFEGLYAGVYGRFGEYDILLPSFLRSNDNRRQGKNYGGGLSVGYTIKMLRKHPLYVDFGASLGYDRLEYDIYNIQGECNAFQAHVERNSFGLKRLKASILWRF